MLTSALNICLPVRRNLSLLALAIAGCAPAGNDEASALAANLRAPYDYYINGMQSTRFDAGGVRLYALNASRATHFPSDDHAELSNPDLLWYQVDQEPWGLTANSGTLHIAGDNTHELLLRDNVELQTTLAKTGRVLLETVSMTVLPEARQANSDAAVTLTTVDSRLRSIGMQLNLPDNHLTLLNQVRGTHAP
jgi:lipopolysaccharide export system protein LptC